MIRFYVKTALLRSSHLRDVYGFLTCATTKRHHNDNSLRSLNLYFFTGAFNNATWNQGFKENCHGRLGNGSEAFGKP